ncbi:cyclohexyl-isocyanide hydratase [Arcicella aurantiaca]|uniref:Cyclohexyl-isocyanide hydratase n=1 Tax=Arcicella aurantiaca TaxID=591202 RepID=A0A316DEY9_9BACT|nr:GNAT family N-acetyltransferase [Arcicella aurantiaca]PWK16817.1 cyclohexyl-isocyanide hydratase [Arcicella aurantiaca]
MLIKTITEDHEINAYYNLLTKAITEEAQFFRVTPTDIEGEVFPSQDTFESFTLGAFSENGELLGTVGFKRDSFIKLKHRGLVFRMYVSEKAKGLGLGRKLLQALIERAKQGEGLRQIYLTLIATNQRAKNLYLSEGFELFSLEKEAIKMAENEYVDEASMVKYLFATKTPSL